MDKNSLTWFSGIAGFRYTRAATAVCVVLHGLHKCQKLTIHSEDLVNQWYVPILIIRKI